MNITSSVETDTSANRQTALLDAAVAVFARFGFRKTSMEEVASAAGVSRQGLYLQFANKEELFRRSLEHTLTQQLDAAIAALTRGGESFEGRLIAACTAWCARFIGSLGKDAADLMCASTSLAGGTLAHYECEFERALTRAIGESPLQEFLVAAGMSAAQLAQVLHATARGLKQRASSRDEFIRGMTVAARMFCAPLNERRQE